MPGLLTTTGDIHLVNLFCWYNDKVKRCLASYSLRATTTNQMCRQGLYVPKRAKMAKIAVFGPNILIILRGSKSSGTHLSENHLGTSFALFYWSGMASNGSGSQNLAQNDQKMLVLGHIWPFLCQKYQLLMRVNQSFGTHITEDPRRHLVCIAFLVGHQIKWAQNANFWPKMPVLGLKWPFLGSVKICFLLWKLKLIIFQNSS